ncbi:MAG: alanine racemase [Streptococcaceae bacterium]|jgi:alanine racemase|nr:alanine racemase [Streptococcaceae bacterium]
MNQARHRPTFASVNLSAIRANIKQELANAKGAKVFAVVKANGYGHGASQIAKAAVAAGASGLCVSNLDEALDLRQQLSVPILVLSEIPVQYAKLAIKHQITLTAARVEFLEELRAVDDLEQLKIHLKLDTGMGRIGLRTVEEIKQAEGLINQLGVIFEGVFTHFATADEPNQDYFNQQIERFNRLKASFAKLPELVHVSNTAASLWHQACGGNLVRFGIGIYGLNPAGRALAAPFTLQPALSLISQLTHVKEVGAAEFISYGATYQTKQTEWIGTVPIGYADGWFRRLQGFELLVEGQWCEIIGRICMDQLMIRLPKAFPVGTKVTLIGQDGNQEITMQSVAEYSKTIHYEIACALSDRVPRFYVD